MWALYTGSHHALIAWEQKVFGGSQHLSHQPSEGPLITTTDLDGAYRGESRRPPSHDVETLAAATAR